MTRRVGKLSADERERLEGPLIDVVKTWFQKSDRRFIADHVVFRDPSAILRVMYGPEGEVLGCATIDIVRVQLGGRQHAIFDAGVYLRPNTRGGDLHAIGLGLRVAVEHRLRHPRDEMCFIGAVATPASYCFLADPCPGLHPRAGAETPAFVSRLMIEVARRRGLVIVGQDPLVVSLPEPAPLVRAEKLSRSRRLASSREGQWFVRNNPNFAEGSWLMTYIPLDAISLMRTTLRFGRRLLSGG